MRILVTNLFGFYEAEKLDNIYFGSTVAGFRARVLKSNLPGWRVGQIVECGTLTKYKILS